MWLVGAGYWGSKLLAGLAKFNVQAQVIDIRNGQTIADITDTGPVMLATPLWQHHEQACQLLRNGHDLYVEKPMAETYNEILGIGSYVRPGQLLMVGHIFSHHPQMAEIKQLIGSGAIGDLVHISSRRLNWGIYQTRTDPLLSLAAHDISILIELTGDLPKIDQAQQWNYSGNVQPDRVWFSGTVNDSITVDVDVSWHWPVRTRQTVIVGTLGQITWDQDANTINITRNQIVNNRAVADNSPELREYNYELTPLEAELKHWVDCIVTRQEPATGLQQARQVALVIQQVKELLDVTVLFDEVVT